ncbi:MAG: D-glycero-beta-D-manno-heptose-7-phosphate kinase [Elusimicrobiota bacterium]
MQREKLIKIIKNFSKTEILVIGDIMLDKFIWGKVTRISPEAPVPVVEITKETLMPGGAGNVVTNITTLGGISHIIGIVGNDSAGNTFVSEMENNGVGTKGIIVTQNRPTIVKTRIIAHHQQVVRVDKEVRSAIEPAEIKKLITAIEDLTPKVKAVVISDYGKGVITKPLLTAAIKMAKKYKKPILVDPKIEHFKNYKNVTCITPNTLEAMQGMHCLHVESQSDVEKLGDNIMKQLNVESLIITQGEHGMTIFEKNGKKTHIPTMAREVYDVTGAGDTVISTLAMCLANKGNILESAYIANYAAGIVVGKLGTATVTSDEIISSIKDKV